MFKKALKLNEKGSWSKERKKALINHLQRTI